MHISCFPKLYQQLTPERDNWDAALAEDDVYDLVFVSFAVGCDSRG
jgi:hypothetical protein